MIPAVSIRYNLIDDLSKQVRADNDILSSGNPQFGIAAIPGKEPLPTIRGELDETFGCHQIQHCVGIVPQEVFDRYAH